MWEVFGFGLDYLLYKARCGPLVEAKSDLKQAMVAGGSCGVWQWAFMDRVWGF